MIEPYPLTWPEGWPRTLLRDRLERKAWKDTLLQSAEKLRKELQKTKVLNFVISCNIPPSGRNFADVPAPGDTGVAIYFSRERDDDYSWQETLQINSPSPSEREIKDAFKRLAGKYHPDNTQTGDRQIYGLYDDAMHRALDFVQRKTGANYQQVLACDTFSDVKWNMRALQMGLSYLRGLENCGVSAILERAFAGFAAITERASGTAA